MQTITRAVNQQVADQDHRILNVAKLADYNGTDTEDPFEWIEAAKVATKVAG